MVRSGSQSRPCRSKEKAGISACIRLFFHRSIKERNRVKIRVKMCCASCGAAWTLPDVLKTPDVCPFCGAELKPAPERRAPQSLEEALLLIAEQYGVNTLADRQKALGLFADLAPALESERMLLRHFFDAQGASTCLAALESIPEEQQTALTRVVQRMTEELFIAEDAARRVCAAFWHAIGGQESALGAKKTAASKKTATPKKTAAPKKTVEPEQAAAPKKTAAPKKPAAPKQTAKPKNDVPDTGKKKEAAKSSWSGSSNAYLLELVRSADERKLRVDENAISGSTQNPIKVDVSPFRLKTENVQTIQAGKEIPVLIPAWVRENEVYRFIYKDGTEFYIMISISIIPAAGCLVEVIALVATAICAFEYLGLVLFVCFGIHFVYGVIVMLVSDHAAKKHRAQSASGGGGQGT